MGTDGFVPPSGAPTRVAARRCGRLRSRSANTLLLAALMGAGPAWAGFLAPAPAAAQVEELVATCAAAANASEALCRPAVLTTRALQAGVGLAAAGGNAFTGSGSTLGRRYGATPRIGISGALGFTRFPIPDGAAGGGSAGVFAPSAHAQVTVGVLNGFSLAPTLGGFLSLDLLAGVDAVFLPGSSGFQGNTVAWSYGARVGIFRESFTLPGLTLSVSRNHAGTADFESLDSRVLAALDVTTTSWRAVLGKDLAGLGFTLGAGWDDYDADGEFTPLVPGFDPPGPVSPIPFSGFESDRALFFGGVSRTFLVLQISGELGWARGFSGDTDLPAGFDPGGGSLFGAVSLRLTL